MVESERASFFIGSLDQKNLDIVAALVLIQHAIGIVNEPHDAEFTDRLD